MRLAALALAACLAAAAPHARAECRQALALGLDVSGSVDMWEYRLQLDGLATALLDKEVHAAFFALPQAPVQIMIFEWSGIHHRRPVIGWTEVNDPADLVAIAGRLRDTRKEHVNDPSTAIGAAMIYGAAELQSRVACWRRTLDISGDGPANIGVDPADVTDAQVGDVVINGLVIGPDARANTSKNLENVKSLEGYYRSFVVRGPGAFVEVAIEYEDFANAMRRKLIRELAPAAVSMAAPPVARPPSRGRARRQ